jgi:hypothetical protein
VFIAGCASTPNSFWFENGMMNFEVLEVGPKQYKLIAMGAGALKREQVERAFSIRANQLCEDKPFPYEFQSEPRQYTSSGGGFAFVHNAFKTTGVVKCR